VADAPRVLPDPRRRHPRDALLGGATDTVPGFDFDAASRYAASALADDGHPVWTCVHDLEHWVPDDATTRTRAFFGAVRSGDDISLPACDDVD